jgi:hypothetical protein
MNLTQKYLFIIIISAIISCSKDKTPTTQSDNIDEQLFNFAKDTTNYVWYKNNNDVLVKSTESGHPFPFLKTRYNEIAAQQLDVNGKIKSNAKFLDGSLIVKELINSDKTLGRYAILYKKSNNSNADNNGWVWGYIDANGKVAFSADQRGSSCISCHSQGGSIDYMLMNKFFP